MSDIYENFLRETRELWEFKEDLSAFLRQAEIIEKYQNGELGNNEQLEYRAVAIKENMEYFKRLLQILEDIFVKKSIESLVNEIKLEQQYLI